MVFVLYFIVAVAAAVAMLLVPVPAVRVVRGGREGGWAERCGGELMATLALLSTDLRAVRTDTLPACTHATKHANTKTHTLHFVPRNNKTKYAAVRNMKRCAAASDWHEPHLRFCLGVGHLVH